MSFLQKAGKNQITSSLSGWGGEILLTQIKINQLLYQYDIVIKVVARTHPTLTVAGW